MVWYVDKNWEMDSIQKADWLKASKDITTYGSKWKSDRYDKDHFEEIFIYGEVAWEDWSDHTYETAADFAYQHVNVFSN